MTRPLAGARAAAIALSGLTVAAHGHRVGAGVGEIPLPLGAATIAATGVTAAQRVRIGGLRRQVAALVAIGMRTSVRAGVASRWWRTICEPRSPRCG